MKDFHPEEQFSSLSDSDHVDDAMEVQMPYSYPRPRQPYYPYPPYYQPYPPYYYPYPPYYRPYPRYPHYPGHGGYPHGGQSGRY